MYFLKRRFFDVVKSVGVKSAVEKVLQIEQRIQSFDVGLSVVEFNQLLKHEAEAGAPALFQINVESGVEFFDLFDCGHFNSFIEEWFLGRASHYGFQFGHFQSQLLNLCWCVVGVESVKGGFKLGHASGELFEFGCGTKHQLPIKRWSCLLS